jgi:hypothetical protein
MAPKYEVSLDFKASNGAELKDNFTTNVDYLHRKNSVKDTSKSTYALKTVQVCHLF